MINLFGILLSGGEDIYNDPSETNFSNVGIFVIVFFLVLILLTSGNNNKPKAT
jgi:hypothetical protein